MFSLIRSLQLSCSPASSSSSVSPMQLNGVKSLAKGIACTFHVYSSLDCRLLKSNGLVLFTYVIDKSDIEL